MILPQPRRNPEVDQPDLAAPVHEHVLQGLCRVDVHEETGLVVLAECLGGDQHITASPLTVRRIGILRHREGWTFSWDGSSDLDE